MTASTKESFKMKVFPKGQVVIPVSLRRKYRIDIGDQIDVVSEKEGILLKPLQKQENKSSLTERLCGVFRTYAEGKTEPTKKDIKKATEKGFTDGWAK
jgi:AbrB family looped-hinge helix DNA binding protein